MFGRSPRNVIVAKRERAPFAAHCESQPIRGLDHRSANVPYGFCPSVSLRVFIEREGEGS